MPIYQSYNALTKRWVKYKHGKDGQVKILDVKQREPQKPFKGVPQKGQVLKKITFTPKNSKKKVSFVAVRKK